MDLDRLEPLVQDVQVHGRRAVVIFECPESGVRVRSDTELNNAMSSTVRHSVLHGVRFVLVGILRGMFGRSFLARFLAGAVDGLFHAPAVHEQLELAGHRDEAITGAFERVRDRFVWDGTRWLAREGAARTMDRLEVRLKTAPIESARDRRLFARMLVEASAADGRQDAAETSWLVENFPHEVGTVEQVEQRPPLDKIDFRGVDHDVGSTLLTLCWVVAWLDDDLHPREVSLLERWGDALGLRLSDQRDCEADARQWLAARAEEQAWLRPDEPDVQAFRERVR
ncbi:MAG: TerB family tellurite resistance protein [Proteobacteria bacterium]|nr:TerB family tellurite resistance protein [Pseudomonadota bacterium]MCP4918333.1 TerB family tellurite resistance protein [Pseudomonadota bacterium]